MPRVLCAFILLLIQGCEQPTAESDTRAIGVAADDEVALSQLDEKLGAYHAVIIGIDDYEFHQDLTYAERDAQNLERILREHYGFASDNIERLYGTAATRENILPAIRNKISSLGERDHLLIYYAGHGTLDSITERGYWIPQNGHRADDTSWIPFSRITELLEAETVAVRAVAVITDSCYGGAITKRATVDPNMLDNNYDNYVRHLQTQLHKRSRQVLASGGYEEVPDRSLFAEYLRYELEHNDMPLLALSLLVNKIWEGLALDGAQTPMHSHLFGGPNGRGPFVFARADRKVNADPGAVPTTPGISMPALATLSVSTSEDDSAVFVDGEQVGNGKISTDLLPGVHIVRVEKTGYKVFQEQLDARAGDHYELYAQLQPLELPAPEIELFETTTSTVRPGESVTLRWRTANTSTVEIKPLGHHAGKRRVRYDTRRNHPLRVDREQRAGQHRH